MCKSGYRRALNVRGLLLYKCNSYFYTRGGSNGIFREIKYMICEKSS